VSATTVASDVLPTIVPSRRGRLRFLRFWTARVGLVLFTIALLIALLGPVLAPHSPTEIVGVPFSKPSGAAPLGTDFLGRDVLSRVLYGGRTLIGLAMLATLGGYAIGLPAGLVAGYRQGKVDFVLMRAVDVLLAFPPLLFLLVVATGTTENIWALVAGVAIILAPGLTRIVRAAVLDVSQRSYVEAALARGEATPRILRREIVPNILGVILADVGLRLTYAILLIAAMNFLGLGLQPPKADWALMISENRIAISLQPWAVFVPAILIASVTVSINLIADGIARSLGTSIEALGGEAAGR
jgi:ABC-type dipeptide/oligopeptide/nickel transport system permease subunit